MEQIVFSSLVGIVFFVFATLPALIAYVIISIKQQEKKTQHHVFDSRIRGAHMFPPQNPG
jgi:hypothetical protein